MKRRKLLLTINVAVASFFLGACQTPDFSQFKENPLNILKTKKVFGNGQSYSVENASSSAAKSLNQILDGSLKNGNSGSDFASVIKAALQDDPVIISKRKNVASKAASIGSTEAQKDFQVSSTFYGGIEDVTDNTKGLAVALSASRLVFDGGMVDAQIAAKKYQEQAARSELRAVIDERAARLGRIWVELEKYETLKDQIDSRLAVLDPLIDQLEQVAKAGIGDVSKVTAAQRTVATIRVTETNIAEGLEKARLDFANAFGKVAGDIRYDPDLIAKLVPENITDELTQKAPSLLTQYANYQSSLARITSLKAKDDFNVGFEAKAMRPFAGSGYDSDESVGLVARKTIFNGGMLESEIAEAEGAAEASLAQIQATYREGVRVIESARQNIESMDKAIALARENASLTADEIVYLRQQLIIGGSTLDSVLSAEARLYDAESKEISFIAEKRQSQLVIVTALGLLGPALGL